MRPTIKKVNAWISLAAIALLLVHLVYTVTTYILFYYNPVITRLIAHLIAIPVIAHIVLSVINVFIKHDTVSLRCYPKQNVRTILQRVTALVIVATLLLHFRTAKILAQGVGHAAFRALVAAELVFWAAVLLHTAVSLTNALVTLGWLVTERSRKRIDRVVWVIGVLLFVIAACVVVRTQTAMFYV